MTARKTTAYALLALGALLSWGCGEVRVTPTSKVLLPGEATQFQAVSVPTNRPVTATWSSSNPHVIEIAPSGLATARNPGKAAIRCQSGTARTHPAEVEVASIRIAGPQQVRPRTRGQFTAWLRRSDAGEEAIPGVQWESSNPEVLDIDSSTGWATGKLAGDVTITCRVAKASPSSANVNVPNVLLEIRIISPKLKWGEPVKLEANGYWAKDPEQPIPVPSPTWLSSNTNVLEMDSSTGLATARRAGETAITCSYQGVQARLGIVLPRKLLSLVVLSPSPGRVVTGETLALRAEGTYSDNLEQAVTVSPRWQSSDPHVTEISEDGKQVITRNPGAAKITCTVESKSAEVGVEVALSPPRQLGIDLGKKELEYRSGKPVAYYELDMIESIRRCYAEVGKRQPEEVRIGFLEAVEEGAERVQELLRAAEDDQHYRTGESMGIKLKTGEIQDHAVVQYYASNLRALDRPALWAFAAGLVKGYASVTSEGKEEKDPAGEARDAAKAMYGAILSWATAPATPPSLQPPRPAPEEET